MRLLCIQDEAKAAKAELSAAQKEAGGPALAALRLELRGLQEQLALVQEETVAAEAGAAEFAREVENLPELIAKERAGLPRARQEVLAAAREQVLVSRSMP